MEKEKRKESIKNEICKMIKVIWENEVIESGTRQYYAQYLKRVTQ